MATYQKALDPVQVELFKLALEKRQQAMQAAQLEMQNRMKPIADAHGVPDGLPFDIVTDDALPGAFLLKYDTPDAPAAPQLALVEGGVDQGEGPEA